MRGQKSIEATAYHEAGHAVCYLVQGLQFEYITIKPDTDDNSLGHIKAFPYPEWLEYETKSRRAISYMEKSAIETVGGFIAEMFHTGRKNNVGARDDFSKLYRHLCHFSADLDFINAYVPLVIYKTRSMLLDPLNWRQVQTIASALIERKILDFKEASMLARKARKTLAGSLSEQMQLARQLEERRRQFPFKVTEFCRM